MSNRLANLSLVLGGARSGKTAFAERLTECLGPTRCYIATAEARDAEMAERIALHQADRGNGWLTNEAPLNIAPALAAGPGAVMVDCLTMWLSNLMEAGRDIDAETDTFLEAVENGPQVICVSNEIGMGLVPETAIGRKFRDAQGRLNQRIAARAGRVAFVAAGLPIFLKGSAP